MTTIVDGVKINLTPEQIELIATTKTFKVGVKVVALKKQSFNGNVVWTDGMTNMIGKVGIITGTKASTINGELLIVVEFHVGGGRYMNYTYYPEWLELVPDNITDKVKSWEDAKAIVMPNYYVASCGDINTTNFGNFTVITENHVASEVMAKSVLAYSKLLVIADALNEGNTDTYYVYYDNRLRLMVDRFENCQKTVIHFASEELAVYAKKQFKDLWMDYFMV